MDLTILTVFLRLLLAVICGGLIGMERGQRRQAAGMRTHMLVCVGAALAMCTNQYAIAAFGGGDPTRLGAQVISGIGFLGVGTIIVDKRNQVKGLTTAAGLWACACMGLAIGIGFYSGALTACIFIFLTIVIFNKLEYHIIRKTKRLDIQVEFENYIHINKLNDYLLKEGIQILGLEVLKAKSKKVDVLFLLKLSKRMEHTKLLYQISELEGIYSVEEMI